MIKNALLSGLVYSGLISLFVLAANDWRLPWADDGRADVPWCSPHDMELEKCEICNPALARGGTEVVRLRDPGPEECPNVCLRLNLGAGVAERVGLEVQAVREAKISERMRANAETQYPPGKYARVAPRSSGVIKNIPVTIGEDVEAGSVLATLDSPVFGEAKADYLQALDLLKLRKKNHETEKSLYPKITTVRQLMEAETDYEEAKLRVRRAEQKLHTFGLSPAQIEAVNASRDASPVLDVVAPFAGTIVDTSAVPGELGGPNRPIFGVAQMDRMWLLIDVYERDLSRIEPGQKVFFTVEGLRGKRFPGRLVAIGGEVDDRTRTVRVYADLKNVQGLLRANMFGRAEIRIQPPEPKLLVPRAAVQDDGDCQLVFVAGGKDVFLPRRVELGSTYGVSYEVVGGLSAGENVVTTGSFLLKTEILRGQIGAG